MISDQLGNMIDCNSFDSQPHPNGENCNRKVIVTVHATNIFTQPVTITSRVDGGDPLGKVTDPFRALIRTENKIVDICNHADDITTIDLFQIYVESKYKTTLDKIVVCKTIVETITLNLPTTKPPTPPPRCDFNDLVITELASTKNINARFIEIFFFDQKCHGLKINQDLRVEIYPKGSYTPFNTYIPLEGLKISKSGFVTICYSNQASTYAFYGLYACTDVNQLAGVRGGDTIAVTSDKCRQKDECIIDIFGYPGEDDVPSPQYIRHGRAVRKTTVTKPSKSFKPTDWHVFPGKCGQQVGYKGMDINEWKDVQGPICAPETTVLITEIVDYHRNNEHGRAPRYVELYAPWKKDRETYLDHDLKLVIFPRNSKDPTWSSAINIAQFPENGFLLVCNRAAYRMYAEKCGILDSLLEGPANSAGRDTIALVSGDENRYFVVDIYGKIGESSGGKN
jgi:hypothetical protein